MGEVLQHTTLQQLIEEEWERTHNASENYGCYFDTAHSAIQLLNSFLVSISQHHFLVAALMSSVKKFAVLSFLSHIRAHSVQAAFNARQMIESCVLATYLLAHPNEDGLDPNYEEPTCQTPKSLSGKAYRWLDLEYPIVSSAIKYMKNKINDTYSHASIFTTQNTFDYEMDFCRDGIFHTSFFDQTSDDLVELHLINGARLIHLLVETIRQVASDYRGLVMVGDVKVRLAKLESDVEAHRRELIARFGQRSEANSGV